MNELKRRLLQGSLEDRFAAAGKPPRLAQAVVAAGGRVFAANLPCAGCFPLGSDQAPGGRLGIDP